MRRGSIIVDASEDGGVLLKITSGSDVDVTLSLGLEESEALRSRIEHVENKILEAYEEAAEELAGAPGEADPSRRLN